MNPTTIHETKSELHHLLTTAHYTDLTLVGHTAQGTIYSVTSASTESEHNTCTIKAIDKSLHDQSLAYIHGRLYVTQQSISKEASILRYLSSDTAAPAALIKYKDFICGKYNYYLFTEDIGESMFDIVSKCHQLIRNKHLDIDEWHKFCKIAMTQMVQVLEWMHNTMHCCHLDVSLENFSVKNMDIIMTPSTGKIQICPDFHVKLRNFGVAEVFRSKNDDGDIEFRCNKYVGKTAYKAPKVFAETSMFDARKADCWSLAWIGSAPFERASSVDPLFNYIMKDQMIDVLKGWDVMHYVTPSIYQLLRSLFVVEEDRLTMTDIKHHCWLKP